MDAGRSHCDIQNPQRHLLPAFFSLLLLALAGCASLPQQAPVSDGDIAWILAGADMLPASGIGATEDLNSLLHVTDEMRQFARDVTRGENGIATKTTALATAIGSKTGLHLLYDAGATLTAEQVFRQRRANCLSYTLLFIALAREVGIPARFNEVDIPPIWDMGDDKTLLLYKHINARVDLVSPLAQIIDISGDEYDPHFDQRIVSDLAAQAQFYNNRAVELRLQQNYADALRYQLRALQLSPDAAYLWTNLASLYLLNGSPRAARIAITQALALDTSNRLGYDVAAQIYEQLGDHARSAYFSKRAQHFLDQSPYYHYQLAMAALRAQNDRLAYSEAHRAILLYPKDPRFFFLAAVVLERLGETVLADDCLQVVIGLTQDANQQARYRSKFAQLTKHG